MSKIIQMSDWVQLHSRRMTKSEFTPKQISVVPCPTRGVPAGKRCELHSGALRSGPHADRKFLALEDMEGKKRISAEALRSQRNAKRPHPREVQGEQKAAVTDGPRCAEPHTD